MIHQVLVALVVATSTTAGTSSATATAPPSPPGCQRVCEQEISNAGMRDCLKRDQEVAQKELDVEVAAVRKELSSRGAEGRVILDAFEKSQTAWFSYQGAVCQAVAENWAGGTGQRVALVFCLTEHIRQRTFEIWRNYHLEQLPEPAVLCRDSQS